MDDRETAMSLIVLEGVESFVNKIGQISPQFRSSDHNAEAYQIENQRTQ